MDPVAEAFEAQRDRLQAVAHRLLGSHADAEDVVQEAWLRLSRQDTAAIHNLAGWLQTSERSSVDHESSVAGLMVDPVNLGNWGISRWPS